MRSTRSLVVESTGRGDPHDELQRPGMAPLLAGADFDRLGNLYVVARTLVAGLYHGRHATSDRGGMTEFYDYRMYVPGDEPRNVDWRLYGRTDRLYIRRYRHYSELTLHLIVDASASMDYTGLDQPRRTSVTKFKYASFLAAAMAFLVIRQGDRAALTVMGMGDGLSATVAPGGTWPHLYRVIRALEDAIPAGGASIAAGLHAAFEQMPQRRLVVLLSDLMAEPGDIMNGVDRFRHKGCDMICIQVLTRQELDLSGLESARFIDAETSRSVRTFVPEIRQQYMRLIRKHNDHLARQLTARGVAYHSVRTETPPLTSLRHVLHRHARPGTLSN